MAKFRYANTFTVHALSVRNMYRFFFIKFKYFLKKFKITMSILPILLRFRQYVLKMSSLGIFINFVHQFVFKLANFPIVRAAYRKYFGISTYIIIIFSMDLISLIIYCPCVNYFQQTNSTFPDRHWKNDPIDILFPWCTTEFIYSEYL